MQHIVKRYGLYLDDGGDPGRREYRVSFDGTVSDRDDLAIFAQEMRLQLQHFPSLVVAIFVPEAP